MSTFLFSRTFFVVAISFALFSSGQVAFAATYYVDATTGDDSDSGLTTDLAWATVNKVSNAALSSGDLVLFKRGETWRSGTTLTAQAGVTYGVYGSGAKPIINAGTDLLGLVWSDAGSNRWTATFTTDPQTIFLDGTRGLLQVSQAAVNAVNEYFWSSNTLTVFSTSNPSSAFTSLEAVVRETIHINQVNVSVDNLDLRFGISNILVQQAGSTITNVEAYRGSGAGIYFTGAGVTSGTVVNSSGDYNGTGIVMGGSAANVHVTGGTWRYGKESSNSAGDGIQISEDAGDGHTFDGITAMYNDRGGINLKIGTVIVRNCTLTNNYETGMNAQVNLTAVYVEDCYIADNNQLDNGVPNLAIENSAVVYSKRNYYGPVNAVTLSTANVNLTGSSAFHSQYDYFQGGTIASALWLGHIRTNTGANAAAVTVQNATVYDPNADSNYLFRFGGATGLTLSVYNTIFYSSGRHMIEYVDDITANFDNNQYYSTDINTYIHIIEDGSFTWLRQYLQSQFASLQSTEGTDADSKVGDPKFVSAPTNVRLLVTSPGIDAGRTTSIHTAATTDFYDHFLTGAPDIGAAEYQSGVASRVIRLLGNLRVRGIRLR